MSISVITPSYNSMPYVERAIRSVLDQLDSDDEIIVQDGVSTDGTLEVLHGISEQDPRVVVMSERDMGQSDALNRALSRASREYVLWLNADDVVLPGAIAAIKSAIMQTEPRPQLIVGGHQTIDHTGKVIANYRSRRLEHRQLMNKGCYIFSGSLVVTRELMSDSGGFGERFHYSMDLDLQFRLVEKKPSQHLINVPIGALRWHDASKSGSVGNKFARESWKVRSRHRVEPVDLFRGIGAFMRQSIAISTTGIRHSAIYKKVRGSQR
jgi:glycosyltransferase involved in cell wall biosynthesis